MTVRIYEISKKINLSNKETLSLLKERGFDVKTASSSIADICAEEIFKEFENKAQGTKAPEPKAPAAEEKKAPAKAEVVAQNKPKAPAPVPVRTKAPALPVAKSAPVKAPSALPAGALVKSADQVTKEREERKAIKSPVAPVVPAKVPAPVAAPVKAPSAPAAVSTSAPKLPPRMPGKPSAPPAIGSGAPKLPPRPSKPTPAQPSKLSAPEANKAEGTEEAPAAEELKTIQVKPPIVVREFATMLGLKPFKLISELMELGIFASMNQSVEEEVAHKLAARHGFKLDVRHRGETAQAVTHQSKKKEAKAKPEKLESRPPVICVLGHVDHGKTTLLDTLRKANVVAGEAGGITQHIGAYQVERNKQLITFLDTPGHAAFSKMRERGANITDIAILIVAADDGFMPQTDEALKFAQKANVPIVVAINKLDAKGANIDKVKQQMQQRGIMSEDWGGEVLCTPISALKGTNIDDLLESLLLQTEMLELQADVGCSATGTIIESQVEHGCGPTATVIVEQGILKVGATLVCGGQHCKVRALISDKGARIKSAGPSTPVRVLGWSGAPEAGSVFTVAKNEREAKREAEENAIEERRAAEAAQEKPMNLDNLFAAIASAKEKALRVIIKGDVHGSVEALQACLEDIKSEKVKIDVVSASVGLVTKNDIQTASASEAAIVAFNTKLDNGVQAQLKHHDIRLIQHNIIYELIDQVKDEMAELLDPELQENKLGAAEVRQVFPVSNKGHVAGCMVTEGKINRDGNARLMRKGKMIHEGTVDTLKRFKDDATEVRSGYECGIQLKGCNDYLEGDIIESFEIIKIKAKL